MKIVNVFDGTIVKPGDYFLDPYVLFESPEYAAWLKINSPENLARLGRCRPSTMAAKISGKYIAKATFTCISLPGKPTAHHVKLIKVIDNLFTAKALVESERKERMWIPLTVRFTHPKFLFQRVAFINT